MVLIYLKLNPLIQGCFVLSLVEISPMVLKKMIVKFNFVNVFLQFCYYLPLKEEVALHLNKLEFPLPKEALCEVSLKLAQWLLRF